MWLDCAVASRERSQLGDGIFALGPHVRYVAFGSGQDVDTRQRADIRDASSSESDFFEELLVNPTLLALARQRGELDCGGLRYLIVAYGSFNVIVMPLNGGHVTVGVAVDADPVATAAQVAALVAV
jgi:hypothetical protein